MKKAFFLALAMAFVLSFAAPVYALELPKSIDKLANGIVDIVKSPIVLYDHTKGEMDSHDNMGIGLLKGTLEAPFYFVGEVGHGALDVVTFPVE